MIQATVPPLGVAVRLAGGGSLISPGVAGRGARVGDPPRPYQPWSSSTPVAGDSLSPRHLLSYRMALSLIEQLRCRRPGIGSAAAPAPGGARRALAVIEHRGRRRLGLG